MAKSLRLQILTPGIELFNDTVSEVTLPAHDGECGVLAGHEDFVALLGTGALKLVKDSNDYWFMVSSGVIQVDNGEVVVLAEVAEPADEIDEELAKSEANELEPTLAEKNTLSADYETVFTNYSRAKARLEVYRRTHVVN